MMGDDRCVVESKAIMRALVTGFEPFGGEALNASWEAVRRLPAKVGSVNIVTAQLPTSFARAPVALAEAIRRVEPDIVLCVGQAGDRGTLCVERLAVNVQDARLCDNDGALPVALAIAEGGLAACEATLPFTAIVAALQAAGLPATLSESAGTFVCNRVFYEVAARAAQADCPFRAGFLHVPALPEQAVAGVPPMKPDDVMRAISIVLRTTAAHSRTSSPRGQNS
jgi:pyroglutamyl-peptidase